MAEEVRTGLTLVESMQQDESLKTSLTVLDRLEYGRPLREHVREFGALIAALLLAIGAYLLYRNANTNKVVLLVEVAGLALVLGYGFPILLYPIWKAWMAFANLLGVLMSAIVLALLWTIAMVPLALVLSAVGKRVMDLSFKADVESYWETREDKLNDFQLLKRQF